MAFIGLVKFLHLQHRWELPVHKEITMRRNKWKNLAPNLIRQRVIIEGVTEKIVEPDQIKSYLRELSRTLGMKAKGKVLTYVAEEKAEGRDWSALNMGYAGWLYWVSSGVHFHSYPTTPALFTIDAYTCKPFSAKGAAEFTRRYFNAVELVWKEIPV